ncbi:MAG TPA: hypothetical protein VK424_04925 [Thermoplasmata archaeon]|nr:hypothetical protein [Thermoplasmata archaeon]
MPVQASSPHPLNNLPARDSTALIHATVLLVIIAGTVGAWVYIGLVSIPPAVPETAPIGSAFAVGNPTNGTCPSASTFLAEGCRGPTHFYFRLAILASTVQFGDVQFIIHTPSGAIDVAPGGLGFTVLAPNGTVAAQYAGSGGTMSMSSVWTYEHGTTASTPLNTNDTIMIDIGTTNPFDERLQFSALGTGEYSGTTGLLTLP